MTTETTTYPVVLATDENYAAPCGVVMESLLQNTDAPSKFAFFIFGSDLSVETQEKLWSVADCHGATIDVRTPNMERLNNLPLREGFSADAYNKLYAPNELQEFEKVLYLDCDVLVERDVRSLFATDLGDHLAAAVPNGPAPFIAEFNKKHGFPSDAPVFNTGVLLVDPERWARERVAERVAEWIANNSDQLIYRDQDGINVVLNGAIKSLSPQWNMEARHYREWWMGISEWWPQEAEGRDLIVHYTGARKPWRQWVYVPRLRAYHSCLDRTPFSSQKSMSQSPLSSKIRRLVGWGQLLLEAGRVRAGRFKQRVFETE